MVKNEITSLSDVGLAYNVVFCNKGGEIGRLEWGAGELKFKGDVSKSAQQFFDFLKPFIDDYIRGKTNG